MKMEAVSTFQDNEVTQTPKKVWVLAFIFSFLTLLCDGADVGILAFTLTSIKAEFGLTTIQAGALGSWSIFGMAIGGLIGGGQVTVLDESALLSFQRQHLPYFLV